ncbi:hypothetical protein Tco_0460026, partial [Tanacetum coccineum]
MFEHVGGDHLDFLASFAPVVMEYLVKISKKARILELKRRHLKITVLTSNTLYPSRKIRRICACTSLKTTKEQDPIRRLRKKYRLSLKNDMPPRDKKLFKTLSLDELRSPQFNLFYDLEEYSKEEVAETMEQYMSKTRADYGSRITRPKINDKDSFELNGQFLKELRDNTFSGSDHEDANEHIKKVIEIVYLFHIPNITQDQVMLRAFFMSLTGVTSRWLRNKPSNSIITWEDLKTKFLSKHCPPARTAKKIEEINNFQQEPDETLYQGWERFKELLMKCPQHYLTDVQTRQILDSKGAIPSKTTADAKVAIQEMAKYSQKWHNGTSRTSRGGYRAAAPGFYQRNNANLSYQERRQSMEETLSKFMSESAKRHEENSNMIKEIRA